MPLHPAPNVVVAERFRLNRLLGRGGMGSVWHATHLGLDVPCAVKFIEGEGAQLPEMQARFEREAKAAAQLRSPHVVQILDHGVCQGTPYIAMELLDGEDLGKRLARVGRLPPHELLRVIVQVSRALTKAHSVGIVHRDLKPDNIFLVSDDDREIAKVLDFGIAKATGPAGVGSSTRTGAMLGTPYYMSPEQAQGTKAVDARSDLWSLAVIVFEALTGRRPFESEALGDLLMKIIVSRIPRPSEVAADLPPRFDAWWEKASQRDPAQRYQTAKELSDALTAVFGRSATDVSETTPPPHGRMNMPTPAQGLPPRLDGGTSTAGPMARTFGVRPPGARNRAAVVAAIGGGLVVLVASVVGVSLAVGRSGATPGSASSGGAGVVASGRSADGLRDAMIAVPSPVTTAAAATTAQESVGSASVPNEEPPPAAKAPAAAKVASGPMANPPAVARPTPAPKQPPAMHATPPTPPAPVEKKKTIDLGI
jgi:serine/threonine-protein kinase